MADLNEEQVETAKFAFDIYDSEGNGTIDAVDLGRILYALNLNPTMATIEKLGGTKKKGEKKFTLEEFLPIYSQELKDKDQGVYEDFLECLKLYDKQEDGTMLGAELSHMLISLGERLDETQANEVLADCLDPEDEDGFVNYAPFLARICDKPVPGEDGNPPFSYNG
uniref:Myosin light chain alkali n=1 Tax=Cacopsylla melanoneura TaxID=428564 RepID=A0A8D8VTS3_9HEMI